MNSNLSTFLKPPQNCREWENLFIGACKVGNLELIRRLCNAEFKEIANIHTFNESGFQLACQYGHKKIVEFLSTSEELIQSGHSFVDIHMEDEYGFRLACKNGHLEIVKFLTTAPELLEAGHYFVDIHTNNEQGFRLACQESKWTIIQFLIFDLQIKRNSVIDVLIQDCPQAEEFFKVREEQERLHQSLTQSRSTLETPTIPAQKDDSCGSFSFRI